MWTQTKRYYGGLLAYLVIVSAYQTASWPHTNSSFRAYILIISICFENAARTLTQIECKTKTVGDLRLRFKNESKLKTLVEFSLINKVSIKNPKFQKKSN